MIRFQYSLFFALFVALVGACKEQKQSRQGEDAFFRTIEQEYTLNADGSVDYRYAHELDLYSYMAFNRQYGESFIVYNPQQQELNVTRSETVMSGGQEVPSPENAYNEVLPRFAAGVPTFSHLREMVVTHTGLERNSTIHFAYNLHSNPGYYPFLSGVEQFAQSAPVGRYQLKIRLPADQALYYKMVHKEVKPKITKTENFTEYTWTLRDIPATAQERHQPSGKGHLPGIVFSTKSLKDCIGYLQEQLQTGITDAMQEKAQNLQKKDKLETINAVRDLVSEKMNSYAIPFRHTGCKIRSNQAVWKGNGGTPMEKAMFMSSLLNEAGVRANPVVAIPDSLYKKEVGALEAIKEVLVETHLNEKQPVLISPTKAQNYNLWRETGNYRLIPLIGNMGELFTLQKPGNCTTIDFELDGRLNKRFQLSGDAGLSLFGVAHPFFKLQREQKQLKSFFPLPPEQLARVAVKSCSQQDCSLKAPVMGTLPHQQEASYFFVNLLSSKRGIAKWNPGSIPESRKAAYEVPFPVEERYEMQLKLPEDMQLVSKVSRELSNKAGKLSIVFKQQGDTLSVLRHIHIPQKTIVEEALPGFKALINSWNKEAYKRLVLKMEEPAS